MKLTNKTMKEEFTQMNNNFSITMSEHEGECLEGALLETANAMGLAADIFNLLKAIVPHASPVHPGVHSLLHICFMGFETMAHCEAEWLHKAENTLHTERMAA
jgi:hypothetical protein